jgi:predicted metalloendopeptidase
MIKPIGSKHPGDAKYHKYKDYYETSHSPAGRIRHRDYCGSGLFWLLMLVAIGGFIAIVAVTWTQRPVPAYIVTTKNLPRTPMHASRKRSECTQGEAFDGEIGMCAPTYHAPLAFDGSIMDHATQHCDSFYQAMCGRWNAEHTNDNRAFSYGYHKNQQRIKKLISYETQYSHGVLLAGPSSSSITDFYRSCITATIDRHKKDQVLEHKHMIHKILGGASSVADMPAVFGKLARAGYTSPFVWSIERHPTKPQIIPLLVADGFPLDLSETEVYRIYKHSQEVHQLNILEMDHQIESVLAISRALRMNNRRPVSSIVDYGKYVAEELPSDLIPFGDLTQAWNVRGHSTMGSAWNVYFQELDGSGLRFHHDQITWVIDKPYFDWLFEFGLAQFTFRQWRAYAEFSILYNGHEFVPDLPDNVYYKQHEERGPLGPGGRLYHRLPRSNATTPTVDVETTCARITQHLLPGLVAKQFLERHFPNKDAIKAEVRQMVGEIIMTFIDMVGETPWMSAADKRTLQEKMHATIIRVAEPDQWTPEPFAERISQDSYWHNLNLIRSYRVQRNLQLWSRDNVTAFDRSALAFWGIPLTEVNAYYSGQTNSITVLAGILQHPFYNAEYNDISKYAILGSILGHELSHMADNNGLYWGKLGSLHPHGILSAEGMRSFYDASRCVVSEYGPAPMGCEAANTHYGNSTLGEDLADLTGIHLSYATYFKVNPSAPMADRQHFFMVLGQAFCETYDQEHLCDAVANDEHAVAMFRINRTFRNLMAFQQSFGCHDGQAMYKASGAHCRVYGK